MNKSKEEIIIEESKLVALSILQDEKTDPDNIKKITDSIDYRNPYHCYLKDNNILSINEYNQRLMYMKQDDFLIKMTDNYMEVLFVQDENIIISLKWDYEFETYSIQYTTRTEERSFEIDSKKMSFIKQNKNTKYSHTFEKENHTENDYELLSKLVMDTVGVTEIETEVINYLTSIYPNLAKIIKDSLEQIKNNLLNQSHKTKKMKIENL